MLRTALAVRRSCLVTLVALLVAACVYSAGTMMLRVPKTAPLATALVAIPIVVLGLLGLVAAPQAPDFRWVVRLGSGVVVWAAATWWRALSTGSVLGVTAFAVLQFGSESVYSFSVSPGCGSYRFGSWPWTATEDERTTLLVWSPLGSAQAQDVIGCATSTAKARWEQNSLCCERSEVVSTTPLAMVSQIKPRITVRNATYGAGPSSYCSMEQITALAKARCDGAANCSVPIENNLCATGDPAYLVRKRMTITYDCGGDPIDVEGLDGQTVVLRCSAE